MRLNPRHALLLVVVLATAGLLWDASRGRPLPPASGNGLEGTAPGMAAEISRLRVAQFNIRRGRGTDEEADLSRTARCLEGTDLAGLNEVGSGTWFGQGPDQAEQLGQALGLGHLYLPTEQRWWHAQIGNGLLSRLPAADWETLALPAGDSGRQRHAARVILPWRDAQLTLLVAHIDRGSARDEQLTTLAALFAAAPAPKLLLADLNSQHDHPVIRAWQGDPALVVTEGRSHEAAASGVDWIVAQGFALARAWRCDVGASDHWLVGAELEARF